MKYFQYRVIVWRLLCLFSAGQSAQKVKEQFKILKYVLGAFMLRRTKAKLMESGTLLLPPVTEITVLVSLQCCCTFLGALLLTSIQSLKLAVFICGT